MKTTMIIIGGGIAGLSAGCYAQMNGYDSTIFEQQSQPGGLCTSWRRGGYLIDGCIHWLYGTAEGNLINGYWKEIGALQGREIYNHDIFTQIEVGSPQRKVTFVVYTDADKLKAHMKALSPEDAQRIEDFTELIKRFADFPVSFDKPFELMKMGDYIGLMKSMKPFMKDYNALKKVTLSEFASGFKNEFMREGVAGIMGGMPDFSLLALVMMLSWQNSRAAGYPLGGSLELSRAVEGRYKGLGGKLRYSAKVEKIVVERNRAVGLRLEDGTEHRADIVVSAADGYSTIFKMLSGEFCDRKIRERYSSLPIFEPFFCLSLGVNRDFSKEPPMVVRILDAPLEIEGKVHRKIGIKHFCFDPASAPAGKSVLQIMYTSDYDYWLALKDDKAAYGAEKKRITDSLVRGLEESYPGIGKDIEMIDVATPLTFERYTGNRRGSFEGWRMTPAAMTMQIPKTLPRLRNFYMVGQWVQPGGGLPNSLKSGRDLVAILCKKNGRPFRTA